ncbi:MAG: asparagine synthetase A [Thermocladium sp.]
MDSELRTTFINKSILELEEMTGNSKEFLDFLEKWLQGSWRWIKEDKYRTMLRVEATAMHAVREFLDSHGFIEALAPIIGPVTDPGIRGAKQATIDFYGHEYKVMSSAILYKQYLASSLGKIYFVSPNIRLEPNDSALTGRHLVEFYQIDLEVRNASLEEVITLAEDLVDYAVKVVADTHGRDLEKLGRALPEFKHPFPRYTHAEAVELVNKLGCSNPRNTELRWECEKTLSASHASPIAVYEYPKGARGFYDREDPQRPGYLRDFDLLYPEGFGEAISGAEREFEPARVIARMRESGEDPNKYRWYLEMLRENYPLQTAGFGIGVERLVRYLCGLRGVWEARPYPKVAGIVSP